MSNKQHQSPEKEIFLPEVLGDIKSLNEVMQEIKSDSDTYSMYLDLNHDFKERFLQFCMGIRGVKMTYDPFFKHIFDAEIHPERLSALLSLIIGRSLKVKRVLPNEHRRITEKGALLFMDILVEFQTGELADVEIQKIGYLFPGQRASCYASDMVMRQYERERQKRRKNFTYRNMKKVYTIVFILELLQEFFFIPLDIFRLVMDNKKKEDHLSELEAWLYFISSDKPEDIRRVMKSCPKFTEMYQEIVYFRYHPKEALRMFSEALRILDENTVNYMIDEWKREIDEQKQEIDEQRQEIDGQRREINTLKQEIDRLQSLLTKKEQRNL